MREESEKYLQNGEYLCTECNDYRTINVYHFRRHLVIHREGRYNCETCGYKASKWKELTDHKKEHLHQDGICSFCNYQSSSPEELEIHMTKHSGNRPFVCNFCDTTFKTKSALQLHFPKHSEDKPYICKTCGAGFKWKHALKNHLVVHSVTKEHLCDVCGFATAHKSQLKSHRLIHTGETFRCEFTGCSFQATKRQNLKYHMLSHTQEKPHQCEICGKSFSLIKNMKRHMLLHTQTRPYQCNLCEFSSTRQDKLREHLLKQHNIGKHGGKKFRITDYNLFQDIQKSEIEHEESVDNRSLCTIENNSTVQFLAQTEDGQTIPFTITSYPSVQFTDVNGAAIGYVAHVE